MERNLAVFTGIAVVMVIAVGTGTSFYLANPGAPQPVVSVRGTVQVPSKGGLLLSLNLNSTVLSPGQTVGVSVAEENTLDAQTTISASQLWQVEGLGVGPCGVLNYPFGFEILSGYYNSTAGLESAHMVQLYAPGVYGCPEILSGIASYSFYPLSDRAQVNGSCTPEPCFTEEMNSTYAVHGAWNGNSFENLTPGVYTVVVGDEWGALLFGSFVVSSNQSSTTVLSAGTTFDVTSSFDCVAGHHSVNFTAQGPSVFAGGFNASSPGVTLYVATTQEAGSTFQGHPSSWVFSTGLVNSSRFAVTLGEGSYVAWIEGADLHCGAKIVMPLEMLTTVNVTAAFRVTG